MNKRGTRPQPLLPHTIWPLSCYLNHFDKLQLTTHHDPFYHPPLLLFLTFLFPPLLSYLVFSRSLVVSRTLGTLPWLLTRNF